MRVKQPQAPKERLIALRIPDELLRAIDREAERLRNERPGASRVARSEAIRDLLYRALHAGERVSR